MSPKVSIVVPMYGVEKYLEKCIDSLIHQTLKDIEIILVDDGSPDRSGEFAERYAKEDCRIKVIHQENAGLGPARNTGMEAASGEYIGFVDSDDWTNETMFEHLYNAALNSNADIAVGGHCDWCDGKVLREKRHPLAGETVRNRSEINEIRKNIYGRRADDKETEAFPMSVWIAIYRRALIDRNQLKFQNIISEDVIFNISAYKFADAIVFTGDTDYCYRNENQTSIMRSFSESKLKKYEDYLKLLMKEVGDENDSDCLMRVKRAAINICRLYVGQVADSSLTIKEKKKFIEMFAKSQVVSNCWDGYPVDKLPLQQKIFQKAIQSGYYGTALLLVDIRKILKNKFRKY